MTQYTDYTDMNGRTRLGTHLVFEALGKMDKSVIDDIRLHGKGLRIELSINGVKVDFQGFMDTLGRAVEDKVARCVQTLLENELSAAFQVTSDFTNSLNTLLTNARANIRREVVEQVKRVVPRAEFEEEES